MTVDDLEAEDLSTGMYVRSRSTGRAGFVVSRISPPRGARSLYVQWLGAIHFSLVGSDEVEIIRQPPGGDQHGH